MGKIRLGLSVLAAGLLAAASPSARKLVMDGGSIVYKVTNKTSCVNGRKIETDCQEDRCVPASAIGANQK